MSGRRGFLLPEFQDYYSRSLGFVELIIYTLIQTIETINLGNSGIEKCLSKLTEQRDRVKYGQFAEQGWLLAIGHTAGRASTAIAIAKVAHSLALTPSL